MPDGLFGLLTMMARVRGVTAAAIWSNDGIEACRAAGVTTTGTARHIFTISG